MQNMFNGCLNLTFLDLSSFDTSSVTVKNRDIGLKDMFTNCTCLSSVKLGPDFRFDGNNISDTTSIAIFPTPSGSNYTGNWIKSGATSGAKSAEWLRDNYNGATMSGTWIWEEVFSYSVAFNANGGSGTMSTQTGFTYGTAKALTTNLFTAPASSGDGWSFGGWATSRERASSGTVDYANQGDMITGTDIHNGTITLYAVWQKTIAFKSGINMSTTTNVVQYYNGETGTDTNIVSPSIESCTDISGLTELGWKASTTAGTRDVSFSTSFSPTTTTYYAVYSRDVHFYSGINKATDTAITHYYNSYNNWSSITTPTASTCTDIANWSELGWRSDDNAANKTIDFNTSITPSETETTYYAVYSRTLTLTYDGNNETSGSMNPQTDTQYYSSSNNISSVTFATTSNGFSKTGYYFSNWANDSVSGTQVNEGENAEAFTPAVDSTNTTKTMYAIWLIANQDLTVTNTVAGSMGDKTKEFSFTLALTGTDLPSTLAYTKNGTAGTAMLTNDECNFTLVHNDQITFNVPYNTGYTITETNGDYTLTKTNDTGTIATSPITASFTNTLNKTIETGVNNHNQLIFMLILMSLGAIMITVEERKRRKRIEERIMSSEKDDENRNSRY
jgi:surface protein